MRRSWTREDTVPPTRKSAERPLLITVDEAARLLGVSRSKLYPLLSAGEIESIKFGGHRRIPRDAVDKYVRALRGQDRRVPPPPI
jgi:excisionase family DNA binding protein